MGIISGRDETAAVGFAAAKITINGNRGEIEVPLDTESTIILKAPTERIARHAMDNIGGWLLGAAKQK
jgi:hypothetical protein